MSTIFNREFHMFGFKIMAGRAATFLVAGLIVTGMALPTIAGEKSYFNAIQGKWSGPGNIVAGKYKGNQIQLYL